MSTFAIGVKLLTKSSISLLSHKLVRQEIEQKFGLDEGSLLVHKALLKEATQNAIVCAWILLSQHVILTNY